MNAEFELIDTGTNTWLVRRDDNGHIREIREPGRPARLQSESVADGSLSSSRSSSPADPPGHYDPGDMAGG